MADRKKFRRSYTKHLDIYLVCVESTYGFCDTYVRRRIIYVHCSTNNNVHIVVFINGTRQLSIDRFTAGLKRSYCRMCCTTLIAERLAMRGRPLIKIYY